MQNGKIFISYRQSDTQSEASRLKENLEEVFGESNVFFDIETLEPGLNFADAIERTIQQSHIVLVLIGPSWTEVKDANGNLRLFNEDDWVRREVAMALSLNGRGTSVIPILVKNAKQLSKQKLPDNIKALADVQWAEISIKRWKNDVENLIQVLRKITRQSEPIVPTNKLNIDELFKPRKVVIDSTSIQGLWKKYRYYIIAFAVLVIIVNSCSDEPSQYYGEGYDSGFDFHVQTLELSSKNNQQSTITGKLN